MLASSNKVLLAHDGGGTFVKGSRSNSSNSSSSKLVKISQFSTLQLDQIFLPSSQFVSRKSCKLSQETDKGNTPFKKFFFLFQKRGKSFFARCLFLRRQSYFFLPRGFFFIAIMSPFSAISFWHGKKKQRPTKHP